jgi:hypothetical protein
MRPVGAEATDTRTQWFQSQAADFYDTVYRSWSHGMTNVSVPVANMLKKSWTLAVSVATNISMLLCFVSVHGPRETYFVDEPRIPTKHTKSCLIHFIVISLLGQIYLCTLVFIGARRSLVVKALWCKPEDRWFDTQWGGFLNLPNPSDRTRPWGLLGL